MTTRTWLPLAVFALALLQAGCEDNPPADLDGGPADGGEVPVDAAPDGGHDAGPRDGGPRDGGQDAELPMDDAGPDSSVPPDGGGSCSTDAECQNADLCDGTELCIEGMCEPATEPTDCGDALDCTADTCVPATGCVHTPIDADGDGDGACTDCDDSNPDRRAGATEICNGLDDNCNGATDEGASGISYSDCDGDGYAPVTATSALSCAPPPVADTGCLDLTNAAWTLRDPSTGVEVDCGDEDDRAFTGATAFYTTAIVTSDFVDPPFDFNCNGVEEPQFPTVGSCALAGGTCATTAGWVLTAPACGESGLFITACTPACTPTTESRTQGCR